MAQKTYSAHAIVVRKTKLGECDVILSLLQTDGSLISAVAKGARKPGATFSSRLELFSEVNLLLVSGKSLDIVKEATLINAHSALRIDERRFAAASACAETARSLSLEDLPNPKLFDMTSAALNALSVEDISFVKSLACSYVLKAFAICGFKPHLQSCISCGNESVLQQPIVRISIGEGGVVCPSCIASPDTISYSTDFIHWLTSLMYVRFCEIQSLATPNDVTHDVLGFLQLWAREHIGHALKSLEFLLQI